MSRQDKRISIKRLLLLSLAFLAACSAGLPQTHAQDSGGPPWGEWLKSPLKAKCFQTWRRRKDPLLNKPFTEEPAETPKGLASKIRAREVDIPNRIRAMHYLAKRDCRVFPEAKEMLILTMQEDKWEEVRFAAATGLCEMLTRQSCNPANQEEEKGRKGKKDRDSRNGGDCQSCQSYGNGSSSSSYCGSPTCSQCNGSKGKDSQSQKDRAQEGCRNLSLKQYWCGSAFDIKDGADGPRESGPDLMELPCHCRSCCDADTLAALAKTAYELGEDGCPTEPSKRIREKAVEAIAACGIPCHYSPYYAVPEELAPPASEEGPEQIRRGGEQTTPGEDESGAPIPMDATLLPVTQASMRAINVTPTAISRLNGMCIVSLKHGRQVRGAQQFQSVHKGRVYTFANTECQQLFDANPESYSVAFGGCDPVHFVQTRQVVEGRYLVNHESRLYMFSTKENISRFRANPERYTSGSSTQVATAR